MRLIDADEFLKRVDAEYLSDGFKSYVRTRVKKMPSIDAVPIIRCKDCIHSTSQVSDDEDTYYCNAHYHGVHSLEFCNHGERKEE